jgi:hypothetical protein
MLFKIYKAYVRGAHLTTQKNSPRFAMYFTGAQQGIFWALIALPVSFYLAVKVFNNFEYILPIGAVIGLLIYSIGRLIKYDKAEYYPDRGRMEKRQIKKEVLIYNLISISMAISSIALVAFIIKK